MLSVSCSFDRADVRCRAGICEIASRICMTHIRRGRRAASEAWTYRNTVSYQCIDPLICCAIVEFSNPTKPRNHGKDILLLSTPRASSTHAYCSPYPG